MPEQPPSLEPRPRPKDVGMGATVRAPALAFIAVTLAIFFTETSVMWFLEPNFGLSSRLEVLVDVVTLLVIMVPLLYFLFVRPMSRTIHEKMAAERALQTVCESLEETIAERTAELEATNLSLLNEIEEHAYTTSRLELHGKLLDAVQQPVIATGKEGVIIYWNRFAEYQFGWTEQEIFGKTLSDVTAFSLEAAAGGLSSPMARKGWSGEVRARRKDSSYFPAHLTYSPILRTNDTVAGFVYSFVDISDRKLAEDAIRHSEEKYSTVVENSPTGILIVHGEEVLYANPRFFEIVKRNPASLGALRIGEIVHPEDWPWVRDLWKQRLAGTKPAQDAECRVLAQDGAIRWVSGRSTVIPYRNGQALLVNIQDVTERHEAVQALQDSQETLRGLSSRLLSVQENERHRVARELHDSIGSTLSAIKLMVERTLDADCPQNLNCHAKSLRTVIPMIQNSVEEVRRISMALRPLTLDDLGLSATIVWFLREFQKTMPDVTVAHRLELTEGEVPEALKINIFRILQEGLNNTAKYGQATRVTVGLRREEDQLVLELQDDGVGFDLATLRPADATGGFGLASMRERAEFSGGELSILTGPGKGTRIRARWPAPSW
ncbi:MAG: PAS domain S-box protein [Holophaga sp.]|nr:PAS domain S-box protein [Holophaga sp.]